MWLVGVSSGGHAQVVSQIQDSIRGAILSNTALAWLLTLAVCSDCCRGGALSRAVHLPMVRKMEADTTKHLRRAFKTLLWPSQVGPELHLRAMPLLCSLSLRMTAGKEVAKSVSKAGRSTGLIEASNLSVSIAAIALALGSDATQ